MVEKIRTVIDSENRRWASTGKGMREFSGMMQYFYLDRGLGT